jgi:type IV secretion system protein VirB9
MNARLALWLMFVLVCIVAVPVWSESVPVGAAPDGRVRRAIYDRDQVYRLQGYVGFEIDLEFQAGESFVGLGSGDIEALSFVSQDNHLFLKPKAPKVSTNLTVLTSRRSYQFLYTAGFKPRNGDSDVIFVVRFSYPPENTDAVDHVDTLLGSTTPRNFDYGYCGAVAIKPIAASDDGSHTRIRFAANSEQPGIFALNEDGSESLLNFNMDGADVVIHRVARQFIVRRGKLMGRIVNQGFSGAGQRLDSGTVSPRVRRAGGARQP